MFLHKSIAIQGNLLCLLYTGQLAESPAIVDTFTGVTNNYRVGGKHGATNWLAKDTYISLKIVKWRHHPATVLQFYDWGANHAHN